MEFLKRPLFVLALYYSLYLRLEVLPRDNLRLKKKLKNIFLFKTITIAHDTLITNAMIVGIEFRIQSDRLPPRGL